MAHTDPDKPEIPQRWRDLHPAAKVLTVLLATGVLLFLIGCGFRLVDWVIDGLAALAGDPTRC